MEQTRRCTEKQEKKQNQNNRLSTSNKCHLSFSAEWRRPVIKLNSKVVRTSEVVVRAGSPLDLRCEGDAPVNWQTRLPKHRRYVSRFNGTVRTIKVDRPTAEFTGTYKCYYTDSRREPTSSVHVYVKGESLLFYFTLPKVCIYQSSG